MRRLFICIKGFVLTSILMLIGACGNSEEVICMYGGPEMDWNDSIYENLNNELAPEADTTNMEQR